MVSVGKGRKMRNVEDELDLKTKAHTHWQNTPHLKWNKRPNRCLSRLHFPFWWIFRWFLTLDSFVEKVAYFGVLVCVDDAIGATQKQDKMSGDILPPPWKHQHRLPLILPRVCDHWDQKHPKQLWLYFSFLTLKQLTQFFTALSGAKKKLKKNWWARKNRNRSNRFYYRLSASDRRRCLHSIDSDNDWWW